MQPHQSRTKEQTQRSSFAMRWYSAVPNKTGKIQVASIPDKLFSRLDSASKHSLASSDTIYIGPGRVPFSSIRHRKYQTLVIKGAGRDSTWLQFHKFPLYGSLSDSTHTLFQDLTFFSFDSGLDYRTRYKPLLDMFAGRTDIIGCRFLSRDRRLVNITLNSSTDVRFSNTDFIHYCHSFDKSKHSADVANTIFVKLGIGKIWGTGTLLFDRCYFDIPFVVMPGTSYQGKDFGGQYRFTNNVWKNPNFIKGLAILKNPGASFPVIKEYNMPYTKLQYENNLIYTTDLNSKTKRIEGNANVYIQKQKTHTLYVKYGDERPYNKGRYHLDSTGNIIMNHGDFPEILSEISTPPLDISYALPAYFRMKYQYRPAPADSAQLALRNFNAMYKRVKLITMESDPVERARILSASEIQRGDSTAAALYTAADEVLKQSYSTAKTESQWSMAYLYLLKNNWLKERLIGGTEPATADTTQLLQLVGRQVGNIYKNPGSPVPSVLFEQLLEEQIYQFLPGLQYWIGFADKPPELSSKIKIRKRHVERKKFTGTKKHWYVKKSGDEKGALAYNELNEEIFTLQQSVRNLQNKKDKHAPVYWSKDVWHHNTSQMSEYRKMAYSGKVKSASVDSRDFKGQKSRITFLAGGNPDKYASLGNDIESLKQKIKIKKAELSKMPTPNFSKKQWSIPYPIHIHEIFASLHYSIQYNWNGDGAAPQGDSVDNRKYYKDEYWEANPRINLKGKLSKYSDDEELLRWHEKTIAKTIVKKMAKWNKTRLKTWTKEKENAQNENNYARSIFITMTPDELKKTWLSGGDPAVYRLMQERIAGLCN
ncbi:MAG: hypothetical protein HQK83_14085 [Fibrobacteria bacterium]|nr:hypothetical protein [Fibrobacteria bacterium]